jgi:hypothetical protein
MENIMKYCLIFLKHPRFKIKLNNWRHSGIPVLVLSLFLKKLITTEKSMRAYSTFYLFIAPTFLGYKTKVKNGKTKASKNKGKEWQRKASKNKGKEWQNNGK